MATEMAVGLAIAQQMMQQGLIGGTPPTPGVAGGAAAAAGAAAGAAPPALPTVDLLGVADVAKVLGVSDADVMAVIEAGELKAKKIGSAYRVTRAALDSYLAS